MLRIPSNPHGHPAFAFYQQTPGHNSPPPGPMSHSGSTPTSSGNLTLPRSYPSVSVQSDDSRRTFKSSTSGSISANGSGRDNGTLGWTIAHAHQLNENDLRSILTAELKRLYCGHTFTVHEFKRINKNELQVECTKADLQGQDLIVQPLRPKTYFVDLKNNTVKNKANWWNRPKQINFNLEKYLNANDPTYKTIENLCAQFKETHDRARNTLLANAKNRSRDTINTQALINQLDTIRWLTDHQVEQRLMGITTHKDGTTLRLMTEPKAEQEHRCNDHWFFSKMDGVTVVALMDGAGSSSQTSTARKFKTALESGDGKTTLNEMAKQIKTGEAQAAKQTLEKFLHNNLQDTDEATTFAMAVILGNNVHAFWLGDSDIVAVTKDSYQEMSHDRSSKGMSSDSEGFNSPTHPPGKFPLLHYIVQSLPQGSRVVLMSDGISTRALLKTLNVTTDARKSTSTSSNFSILNNLWAIYNDDPKKVVLALYKMNSYATTYLKPDDASFGLIAV
jgi:serine/threonine protein phosphatase PrpC